MGLRQVNIGALPVAVMGRPATLRRHPAGAWADNGQFVPGSATETSIQAVIQAASEKDLRVLPEGERTDGYVTIWALVELRTADEDAGTVADEIEGPEGEAFRIVKVGYRPEGGFWRAIGRKIDDRGRSL